MKSCCARTGRVVIDSDKYICNVKRLMVTEYNLCKVIKHIVALLGNVGKSDYDLKCFRMPHI